MKTKSVDERLNDFLGIENEIKETSQELVVKANNDIQEYQEEKNEQRQKDIENDYDFHRHNLHDLVEKGQDTLNNLIELAKQSEHPRAYEVVGQLMKTTGDLTKDLIELQVTMNKIQNTKEGGPSKVVNNNAVFVGNTNDLLEVIKGKNRVIDHE
jgi:hypothetical protein|tara:strand:+ start:5078 stop:5542 length:465 start_codon:yes stop_codon:yes gene_type:complete